MSDKLTSSNLWGKTTLPDQGYYYTYYPSWTNENKISKAFKLVQKLLEKKLIKEPKTIKDFIELVNQIGEIIE